MSEHSAQPGWPAFAGIDWGGSEHQLCVLDTAGTRLTQLRVTHDVAGLAELNTALDTALAQHGTALPIAVERAEEYSSNLCRRAATRCSRCRRASPPGRGSATEWLRSNHHRALRGLAARWMRALWTCWSTHTPYDPKRHTTAMTALTTG